MTDDEMLKLLATDGMLVKRTLLIGDDFVLVGFKEIEQPSWSTKESEMQYLDAVSKRQNDLCSFPMQTIQYHSNPSLCPNQQC